MIGFDDAELMGWRLYMSIKHEEAKAAEGESPDSDVHPSERQIESGDEESDEDDETDER